MLFHARGVSEPLVQCWHLAIPGRTCRCPRGQCRSPHKPLPARGEAPCVRSHASLQQHPGQWEQDQHHKPHQRCWCCCFQLCPARLGKLQVHGIRWCQGWRQAERKGPRPPLPCWRCFETWLVVLVTASLLWSKNTPPWAVKGQTRVRLPLDTFVSMGWKASKIEFCETLHDVRSSLILVFFANVSCTTQSC